MGIDYGSVLVYGWTFDYQDFDNFIKEALGEETYEEYKETHEYFDVFDDFFGEHMKEFKVDCASPYFDSDYTDRTFYISFEFENTEELFDLMADHRKNGLNKYVLLKIFNITDLPQVYALPHIR